MPAVHARSTPEIHLSDPFADPSPPLDAVDVQTVFRGVTIGAHHLAAQASSFAIGADKGVQAPAGIEWLDGDRHTLVHLDRGGCEIAVTPRMTGEVIYEDRSTPLEAVVKENGLRFPLPRNAWLRVRCGEASFTVARTEPAPHLPLGERRRDPIALRFQLATAAALFLIVVAAMMLPADPRAISFDVIGRDNIYAQTERIPPMPPPATGALAGPAGPAASDSAGSSGNHERKARPRAARPQAPIVGNRSAPRVDPRALGILAALDGNRTWDALTEKGPTFLEGNPDILANLDTTGGEGPPGIGLGPLGTGAGRQGAGDRPMGQGGLTTIGAHGGGGPEGSGFDQGKGRLAPRRTHQLELVIPDRPTVGGSLDKEIIRRVIRQHLNEVKYCYEQELVRAPALAGRLVVGFTIAADGRVITAVSEVSMGQPRLESCVLGAVRRWSFPKPGHGGGLTIVRYPFVFTAPSG
jgi:TonB family protein